jgi:hypothetical protein
MAPPFRADHVGSLLRPPELLRARAEHEGARRALASGCMRDCERSDALGNMILGNQKRRSEH